MWPKLTPSALSLRDAARRSALAHIDETGWKVEAQLHWLWGVVTDQITFCEILPGRGFAEAAAILGAEYAGWLIHDGWAVYYKFLKAAHQSCAAHLIRRCRDLAALATPAAARFPLAAKQLLEEGLALRDCYLEQKISLRGLWTATGRLEAKLDRLLARTYREPANRRLAKHLLHERPYLFTFLYCPGLVDATNNLAERVMRMLVVMRKNWGGNRTAHGARAQAILTSVLCTARQRDKDVFELLTDLLRSRQPKLLDILPAEVGAVAESTPANAVVARGPVMETLPACADIPPWPALAPPPRNPCLLQFRLRSCHECNFRGELLRAEVHSAGSGTDARGGAGLCRPGSDRDRSHHLRAVGVDAAQRRTEKSRMPATAGASRSRRSADASRSPQLGRARASARESISAALRT